MTVPVARFRWGSADSSAAAQRLLQLMHEHKGTGSRVPKRSGELGRIPIGKGEAYMVSGRRTGPNPLRNMSRSTVIRTFRSSDLRSIPLTPASLLMAATRDVDGAPSSAMTPHHHWPVTHKARWHWILFSVGRGPNPMQRNKSRCRNGQAAAAVLAEMIASAWSTCRSIASS